MPQTPSSATTPYITPADLLNYRDWRQMADWISINDARGTQGAFVANPVAIEHCNAAGGLLESALLKGERYQVADLQALQTQAGQSWSLCKRLLCFLAIDSMSRFKRRSPTDEDDIKWALGLLEQLSQGERIFAFAETQAAGQPSTTELQCRDHRPSVQARDFFGERGQGRW